MGDPKREEGSAGGVCRLPGPKPSLLTSLHCLADHNNHMLLPNSLHQIAEAYFLEEDYPWAVHFLHLEQLYHERLLANLASLQDEWEAHWKAGADSRSCTPVENQRSPAESKCMDSLSHICQTHQRPNLTMEKDVVDLTSRSKSAVGKRNRVQERPREEPAWQSKKEKDSSSPRCEPVEEEEECLGEELEEEFGEELEEEFGEELEEVSDDDSLMDELREDLAGGDVPSAEKLVKFIPAAQNVPSKGLVSILKKDAYQDGDGIANHCPPKGSYRRKVHFSDADDALEIDEVGGGSCFLFFLLCLVTVVISMGGTALFCLLGGAYSNVCTDFSQNMDFYFGPVRRGLDSLTHWFTVT
ncbi:consortin, connexin sorting protein b isoform X2 [Brachyhypopomus gauderio]|uniref:consortin, connexin sorting protein b isoform X2 n=1 Tax=Brachyhypopomus gauderio TaxID=698409 RepID=UPI00404345A8